MDDIVRQALRKWPDVPDCYGWLGLDMRGQWWLRDDAAQAAGPFPQSKGELLSHDKLLGFIGRNYEPDAQGRWFFQNGPQRVYVELEAAPWVWRLEPAGQLCTHTGMPAQASQAWLDEVGYLYLSTETGMLGVVHTQDMVHAAAALEAHAWPLHECSQAQLAQQFGFVHSPLQLRTSSA